MSDELGPNVENVMSDKSERVHVLVNTGPWPGMSEAFDAHMGAACWTDSAYAPDAATWAAAWKAAKRGAEALPSEVAQARETAEYWKAEHLAGNARIGELHDELAATALRSADHLRKAIKWEARAADLLAACLALKKAGPLGQVEWNAAADMMDAAIAKAVG